MNWNGYNCFGVRGTSKSDKIFGRFASPLKCKFDMKYY